MASTTATSSSSTTGVHSSSSTAPITTTTATTTTSAATNAAATAALATPSKASKPPPLTKTHAVTHQSPEDGNSLELVAMPTDSSSSTKGAKGSSESDDDSKGSTYEIVSKVNLKTGKREYSVVWIEVTEKGNPKRFLGYLKLNPTGNHDQPSPAAKAISDLVDAAEAQDENFKKSSAQTTIKFDGVPAQGDEEEGHEIAILTRGKEKVTLDPKKAPETAGLTEKFDAFHDEIGKMKKIIKQTGADFDPRADKADCADGKKKEPKDISKEEIDKDSLVVYLNRVQQEGSSKIRLQPITKLDELNTDANKDRFKKVTDVPQFIPVEVTPGSYVYLCKDGKDLYYYNPKDAKAVESQPDRATRNYFKNTICENDSSDIGKALNKFAYKHGIKNLYAPKETQSGGHSSQAMGIQWLAHLSKLSPITETTAFIKSVPTEITVPEPTSGDDLSTEEKKQKKAETKKEDGAEAVEEPAIPIAGPAEEDQAPPSLHDIFEGVVDPAGNAEITDAQKDAWLNALHAVIPKKNSPITPRLMRRFRQFVAPKPKPVGWWSKLGGKPPARNWRTNNTTALDALNRIVLAYEGRQDSENAPTINPAQAAFHAKILDNLVSNPALCQAFCAHKGPWGAAPVEAQALEPPVVVAQPVQKPIELNNEAPDVNPGQDALL